MAKFTPITPIAPAKTKRPVRTTQSQSPFPQRRRRADPTGRLDILAIRFLEVGVNLYGDLALRGIYGTYKAEIDRTIRRKLGKVRFYFPGDGSLKLGMAGQPAPVPPSPPPPPSGGPYAR
jgi:hypothetical protein